MQKHTKIYLKHFGYTIADFIPCEICGARCTETHHIHRRGIGGDPNADRIENVQAICRECHSEMGDKKSHKATLYILHLKALKAAKKPFDEEWIKQQIEKYGSY